MTEGAIDVNGHVAYLEASEYGHLYTQQVGGYACHHPEIRAAYIPFMERQYQDAFEKAMDALFCDDDSKYGGWCDKGGIDTADADYIDAALQAVPFVELRLSVDRTRLKDCEEAWVWVVADDGTRGVLTWQNSD